ncbi:MAG: cytochrome c [Magnetococcus sp. DMHC-8]
MPAALVGKSREQLENIILYGVSGQAMPPWNAILSREEVRWLVDRLLEGIPE